MKKRNFSLLTLLCLVFALCACSPQKNTLGFEAMDTYMSLTVYGEESAAEEIEDSIKTLDGLLSTTDSDSVIYKLNSLGMADTDGDTAEILAQALKLCRETDGALDITVYPIVEEWGFISKAYKIPSESRIKELLESVDYTKVNFDGATVSLPEGMKIDLGAVAKGYAADKAVGILKEHDCDSAILNLGGTVAAFGEKSGGKPWRVGIANPENSAAYMGYVDCKNKIVATSGSYERSFTGDDGKTYSHIINPEMGYPVDNGITSVSVISDSGVMSDAFSTALFVMGLDKAMSFQKSRADFDCVILTDSGKAYVSKGISESFTVADGYDYEVVKF